MFDGGRSDMNSRAKQILKELESTQRFKGYLAKMEVEKEVKK